MGSEGCAVLITATDFTVESCLYVSFEHGRITSCVDVRAHKSTDLAKCLSAQPSRIQIRDARANT